jgi:hypothetical protein
MPGAREGEKRDGIVAFDKPLVNAHDYSTFAPFSMRSCFKIER